MNTAINSSSSISRALNESAAVCVHLALGAQRLEARLQCVELRAQRGLVHRRHRRGPSALGLDRHHRPQHREALGLLAAPRSAGPSSRALRLMRWRSVKFLPA